MKSDNNHRIKMFEDCLASFSEISDFSKQSVMKLIFKKSKTGDYIIRNKLELTSLIEYVDKHFKIINELS